MEWLLNKLSFKREGLPGKIGLKKKGSWSWRARWENQEDFKFLPHFFFTRAGIGLNLGVPQKNTPFGFWENFGLKKGL